MVQVSDAPVSPRPKFNFVPVIAVLIVGAVVLWHYGVFRPSPKLVLITSGDTPYWDQVIAGAQSAAQQYDVKLEVVKCKTNLDEQNEKLRNVLNQQVDGVGVSPIDASNQAGVLSDLANHAPLVTFDSDSPVSRRLCFVGTDQYAAGRICGSMVRQALPDGGTIAICVGNVEKENTRNRREGVIDELLDRPYDSVQSIDPPDKAVSGAKFTILPTLIDNGDPQLAIEQAAKTLAAHPEVKCFVGLLGYSAPAILTALDTAGQTGKIKVVGFDTNDRTMDGIKDGTVLGTVQQDQFGCGYQTVRLLAENARGDHSGFPMFQQRTLPVQKITREAMAVDKATTAPAATQPTVSAAE